MSRPSGSQDPSRTQRPGMALDPLLEAATNDFTEVEYAGVGDEIDDVGALAAASDDAGFSQGLEVAGGVGLSESGGIDELGDAEFGRAEALEEAEAGGFPENAKACGDEINGFLGEGGVVLGHGE